MNFFPFILNYNLKGTILRTCLKYTESWSEWPESQDQLSQDGNQGRDDKETRDGSRCNGTSDMDKKQTSFVEEEMEKMLEELSVEERQMLEEENVHLYKELQSNHEEVRQITRQVGHH